MPLTAWAPSPSASSRAGLVMSFDAGLTWGRREDPVAGRWTPRETGLPFLYIRIGMEAPVTMGPGDKKAPAAGRLRASHAERELAISALKTAYVQGRLGRDEFDVRVGRALVSRTHAELAAITADIPVDPAGAQQAPARARPALGVQSGVYLTAAASLLAAVLWAAAIAAGSAAALAAAVAVSGVVILTFFVTGDQLCQARQRKRSAGTQPPRPVPGSG